MTEFYERFNQTIKDARQNDYSNNWDFRRFGKLPEMAGGDSLKVRARKAIRTLLCELGLRKFGVEKQIYASRNQLAWLYDRLEDDESKRILLDVLAFRVLGHKKVKLPLNSAAYWKKLEELELRQDVKDAIDLGYLGWTLNCIDMAPDGYPIRMYARPSGAYTQLVLQQYRCETSDGVIEVASGDTVIDGGGCFGDTALYFAVKAGSEGRVFSFEFMPDNVAIFERNMTNNPGLAARIELQKHPMWSKSGEKLFIEGAGPATRVVPASNNQSAQITETLCIDDLSRGTCNGKVDFIKMDIEGAELEALKGAEETIRQNRPKLAISVYHQLQDFWEIPQWIDQLGVGYRFYLRHFTIHAEETVLFAVAK